MSKEWPKKKVSLEEIYKKTDLQKGVIFQVVRFQFGNGKYHEIEFGEDMDADWVGNCLIRLGNVIKEDKDLA